LRVLIDFLTEGCSAKIAEMAAKTLPDGKFNNAGMAKERATAIPVLSVLAPIFIK